jgi:hypothetical protein
MLTIIYAEAFTRGLNGTAQGPGFEGCFAREQEGNEPEVKRAVAPAVIDL